jgi:hypothetical protein
MKLTEGLGVFRVDLEGQECEVGLVALLMSFLGVTTGQETEAVRLAWSPEMVRALRCAAARAVRGAVRGSATDGMKPLSPAQVGGPRLTTLQEREFERISKDLLRSMAQAELAQRQAARDQAKAEPATAIVAVGKKRLVFTPTTTSVLVPKRTGRKKRPAKKRVRGGR